jgi:hypothetical protein
MGDDPIRPICARIQQLMRTHSFSPTPIAWLEAWSEEAIAHWEEYLNSDNAQTGSSYVENGCSNVCEQTGRHAHWNDHGDAKALYV